MLRGSVECSIGCCFGVFQAPTLLLIALLPASTLKWSLANVRIAVTGGGEPRLLTAMETIQVACMWRVARRTAGMEDVDPLSDPPATVSAAQVMPRRSEVQNMTRAELSQAYLNHIDTTGQSHPYADFSSSRRGHRSCSRMGHFVLWTFRGHPASKHVRLAGELFVSKHHVYAEISSNCRGTREEGIVTSAALGGQAHGRLPGDMAFNNEGRRSLQIRDAGEVSKAADKGCYGKQTSDESGFRWLCTLL